MRVIISHTEVRVGMMALLHWLPAVQVPSAWLLHHS